METLAVVCGATGPLGRATVGELVARGDRVVGVGRPAERLRELEAAVPGARGEVADLTDTTAVEALWKRIDRVDATPRYLVNAIGGFRSGSVLESEPDDTASRSTATWPPRGGRAEWELNG